MAGYILYNGFWNPEVPPDPVRRLEEAARARGRVLTPVPNTSALVEFSGGGMTVTGFDPEDFALFWDKDIRLGRALESLGVRLYNPAAVVEICDDKAATHWKLAEQECYGSLGGEVYLARDAGELRALADRVESRPFLCQEFLGETAGTDLRIYVVDGRVAAAMRRRSDTDFRANIGGGGHGEAYDPSPEEAALAVRCCRILGAQFAGVDLLWDADGSPLVCEVNSNAHMAGITACTGVDVAGEIVNFVFSRERQR